MTDLINIPKNRSNYIIFTTEYSKVLPVSGGIGTTRYRLKSKFSDKISVIMLHNYIVEDKDILSRDGLFLSKDFMSQKEYMSLPLEDQALKIVQILLENGIKIDAIDYQELRGIGARIAIAKKIGLIPQNITTMCRAFSSLFHLEYISNKWAGLEENRLIQLERIALEQSDITIFTSNYLANKYKDYGIKLKNILIEPELRSPIPNYDYEKYQAIENIIFFGRRQKFKGFDFFLNLVENIIKDKTIRKVNFIIIGARLDVEKEVNNKCDELSKLVNIQEKVLNQSEVVDFIEKNKYNSLFILPYKADNFPIALLEVIENRALFLTSDLGGIPEMIPETNKKDISLELNINLWMQKIKEILDGNTDFLFLKNYNTFIEKYNREQVERMNCGYKTHIQEQKLVHNQENNDFSIVITNYNGKEFMLNDLFNGISNQTLLPKEIIIVDDKSSEDYYSILQITLEKYPIVKNITRIIRNEENVYQDESINIGIDAVKTKYVLINDNDNIPFKTSYEIFYHSILTSNYDALSSYCDTFREVFEEGRAPEGTIRYFGSIISTLATGNNELGDTNTIYKTEVIRKLRWGDVKVRAGKNDIYSIFKLIVNGYTHAVIPMSLYHYRSSASSMTYYTNNFLGDYRLLDLLLKLNDKFSQSRLLFYIYYSRNIGETFNKDLEDIRKYLDSREKYIIELESSIANKSERSIEKETQINEVLSQAPSPTNFFYKFIMKVNRKFKRILKVGFHNH